MKKLLLTAAVSAAFPVAAHAEPFSGPYIGLEGGMDNYELSAGLDGGDIDPDLAGASASLDGLSGDGVMGNVFAGYQMPVGPGFVALEGFVGLSDASMSASLSDGVDTFGIKAEAKESYGVAAKFGMRLNTSTGLYARVGWLNTRFKVSATDGVDTVSDSETEDAIQYGAGLETMVAARTALRFEYLIADYGEAGLGDGVDLDNNGFRAGVSYRF